MYYYKLFNLFTASEFPIPCADEIEKPSQIQVNVLFGEMDIDFKDREDTFHFNDDYYFCYTDSDHLYIHVLGFNIAVSNGAKIVISLPKGEYDQQLLYTFTLGSAFGGLCIQRGLLPIHGTTVEYNGKAVIITGLSGAGKSAVSEVLINNGMRFLADDVSVMSFEDGKAVIHPSYPQRKIPVDVATDIGINNSDYIKINEDGRDKYLIKNKNQWCDSPLPLDMVIEISAVRRKDGEYFEPEIIKITGVESMFVLRKNLYRERFYSLCGFEPERMKLLLQATGASKVFRLRRCIDNCPVTQCIDALMKNVFI